MKTPELNIIRELKLKKIITEDFAEYLIKADDIKASDGLGQNIVHFVARQGTKSDLLRLIQMGCDINMEDHNSQNPLHWAVIGNKEENVVYLLEHMSDLARTDVNNQSPLHHACARNFGNIVQLLLNNEVFAGQKSLVDLYGRTPTRLAIEFEADQSLAIIAPKLPKMSFPPLDELLQSTLNSALTRFLSMAGREVEGLMEPDGNCSGWCFMYQVYVSSGREAEFYEILAAISDWDQERNSLYENQLLPETLRDKYKDLQDLFDQIVNDLSVFQHTSEAVLALKLGYEQNSRVEQYELVKSKNKGQEIRALFQLPKHTTNKAQLIEMLKFFKRWPGASIDIGSGAHKTTIYVTESGDLKYFDPNHESKIAPFDSIEALAEHIIKFKYKQAGKLSADGTFAVTYHMYKFYGKATMVPATEQANPQGDYPKSAYGYSRLHYAILENDKASFRQSLHEMAMVDKSGKSPLILAIEMGRNEFVKRLLKNNCDPNRADSEGLTPLMHAVINNNSEAFKLLLENEQLDVNQVDTHLVTALMYATANSRFDMIQPLLEKGASAILESEQKKTAIDYAKDHISNEEQLKEVVLQLAQAKQLELLFNACVAGDLSTVESMISSGMSCDSKNAEGVTILMCATIFDQKEVVEYLINMGADVNAVDKTGMTALMGAAHNGHEDPLKLLLKANAEIAIKTLSGESAIDLAAKSGHSQIAVILESHLPKRKSFIQKLDLSQETKKQGPEKTSDTTPTNVKR